MKNWLKTFVIEHTLPFKQIQFLHPEGKSMPNGICYQRGHYCQVCAENAQKFTIRNNDGEKIVPPSNKGCIVIFPSGRNITFTNNKYFHGNFFEGSYIGLDEEKYGVDSMCIYVDDKSTKESIKFAKALASEHSIHHILVKDLDTNHIFGGDF